MHCSRLRKDSDFPFSSGLAVDTQVRGTLPIPVARQVYLNPYMQRNLNDEPCSVSLHSGPFPHCSSSLTVSPSSQRKKSSPTAFHSAAGRGSFNLLETSIQAAVESLMSMLERISWLPSMMKLS